METILGQNIKDVANGLLILVVTLIGIIGAKNGLNKKSETEQPKKEVELAGALVDSSSIKHLSHEIAGQTVAIDRQNELLEELIRRWDRWFDLQERLRDRQNEDLIDSLRRENERLKGRT